MPTCPDWTLRQLATHVGRVHRWAAEIVGSRAAERIPFDAAPDGRYPAATAERAAWLNAGADRVIAAITAAGDQPVWAFGRLAPASFWARRQSHETMVHRADAELAVGADVVLDAGLAADGIDEWLASVTDPRYRQRGDGSGALPVGSALAVRATGAGSAGDWLISSTAAGLRVERGTSSQPGARSEPGTGAADVDRVGSSRPDAACAGAQAASRRSGCHGDRRQRAAHWLARGYAVLITADLSPSPPVLGRWT